MTRVGRLVQQTLIVATLALNAVAQQPAQFKANVKMKNGSDGTSATGTMYFGGAKMRTELTMDGQNVVVLADPVAKSQYVLMPSDKIYMQMRLGEGPVSMPITGPSDPTNPCGGGSGNTDCVKGPNESVNGYDAVRWDYTSAEGVRTRAWVSTKLRFPVKTQDDNGSSMEFSNIAEGPQAPSLFGIPAGYKKMDIGAMGGMGAGRGNATQSGNPIAAAMANLPPEAQAAMAAAMRGGPPKEAPRTTGSPWERGNGWLLAVTITATEDEKSNKPILGDVPAEGRSTFSLTTKLSIPLNSGVPAAGVPGTPGPIWSHAAGAPGLGSAAAEKLPISGSTTTESKSTLTWRGDCSVLDPGTRTTTMKGSGEISVPLTQIRPEMMVQAMFKLSADLKTYDLLIGASGPSVKEVVQTREETGATCRAGKPTIKDNTETKQGAYGLPATEFNGMPLPSAVGPVTGSKKVRLRFANQNKELDATVSWTLTPIR